jgi:hypothetical protein
VSCEEWCGGHGGGCVSSLQKKVRCETKVRLMKKSDDGCVSSLSKKQFLGDIGLDESEGVICSI